MKTRLSIVTVLAVAALALGAALMPGGPAEPTAQADHHKKAKPLKVLLVLGGCCHDYNAQKDLLKSGLEARANCEVTISYDPDKGTKSLNPAYASEDWSKGYDVVLHDECSAGVADLKVIENVVKPHREGLPAVFIHCAMHSFRSEGWKLKDNPTPWQKLMGLQTTGHGPKKPVDIYYTDKKHPITVGLKDWTTQPEELYNNSAGGLLPTAHELSRGKQGNADAVVTWTNSFGKAKVFGTTMGHFNETVGDDRYLDLVTRGLLWTCGKLNDDGTPAEGYAAKNSKL